MKKLSTNKKILNILLILLLSPFLTQIVQTTHAQTINQNNWAITLQAQKAGQNSPSNVFAPFDQIQLTTNVTYNNAPQPDVLVTFQVQGPFGSIDLINITRIQMTDSNGQAGFSFRLPDESENQSLLAGTWQASATIQTTNNTLQQTTTFTTQWPMQITSMNIATAQGQTVFAPGSPVTVQLAINNTGQAQPVNITLTMQDATGNILDQTELQNTQIEDQTSLTQVQGTIQIPDNITSGEIAVNAAIYYGNYQNTDIPIAASQTAYFAIGGSVTTPTTTSTQNAISLFSWLLIFTGLATFTALTLFLRRKHLPKIGAKTPSPMPSSIIITPSIGATLEQPLQTTPEGAKTSEPASILSPLQQALRSQVQTQLNQISESANRIQALKEELDLEKENLSKDLSLLRKTVEEQQKIVKSYFDEVTSEIEKMEDILKDKEEKTKNKNKTNSNGKRSETNSNNK